MVEEFVNLFYDFRVNPAQNRRSCQHWLSAVPRKAVRRSHILFPVPGIHTQICQCSAVDPDDAVTDQVVGDPCKFHDNDPHVIDSFRRPDPQELFPLPLPPDIVDGEEQ